MALAAVFRPVVVDRDDLLKALFALRIPISIELSLSKYWYCGIENMNSKYWNKY